MNTESNEMKPNEQSGPPGQCQCGCHRETQSPFSVQLESISVRSLMVVDDLNRERLNINSHGDGVTLSFYTAEGELGLKLHLDDLGGSVQVQSSDPGVSTSLRGEGLLTAAFSDADEWRL